jgi:hypothetical protein
MGYSDSNKGKLQITLILTIVLTTFLLAFTQVAAQGSVTSWLGNVTIAGTHAPNGTVVEVYNGTGDGAAAKGVRTGALGAGDFEYLLEDSCFNHTIFLKVWGENVTVNTTDGNINLHSCITGTQEVSANLSLSSLVANGGSCSYTNACTGGFCCNGGTVINTSGGAGTCQASACAAAAADNTGGGGSSGGGGGGGGGGSASSSPPAAPSKASLDTVKAALPSSFAGSDDSISYSAVTAPEVKNVPSKSSEATTVLNQVETIVTTAAAKEAVSKARDAIASGGSGKVVSVKKTIEVIKAENLDTGETLTVSIIKLSISASSSETLENVEIIEVIPKAAASNVDLVTFLGVQPEVLQADPVVRWSFDEIRSNQNKDLSYTINKDISNIGTTTVAVASAAVKVPDTPDTPDTPSDEDEGTTGDIPDAKTPSPISAFIVIAIVGVLAIAGWFFYKKKKTAKPLK